MRIFASILFIGLLLFFQNCKKEEDTFSYCTGCPIDTWVGYYAGSGNLFVTNSGETFENIEVQVNIQNSYGSNLKVEVEAPGFISESLTALKDDENHYLLMGSGAKTLDLGLRKNENQYRLEGTLKKNTWNKVDSVWIVNQSLTFSAMKQ